MDYANLKSEIKEIADLASSVPEPFRGRCFELLLQHLLAGEQQSPPPAPPKSHDAGGQGTAGASPTALAGSKIPIKAQLRVFMQRTTVTAEELQKVLLLAGDEVHFIREPAHGTVSKGQMEWALLLALKNAITSNEFSTDPEDVRSICQEKGFYDRANFAATFKRRPYSAYFRQPLEPQGSRQTLTNEGQSALGDLVKKLARGGE